MKGITCIDHPAAAGQVFLAGDGQDLSTTELLRGVACAAGRPSRLIPVPASFLMFLAKLIGKQVVAQMLLGSLQVDISKARGSHLSQSKKVFVVVLFKTQRVN